jgi:hypothetical protein
MRQQEIVALKLQMGISPSAKIEPGVLLAMWQQLKLECNRKSRNQTQAIPKPVRL